MSDMDTQSRVIVDILDERDRQDAKWGEQNHDDMTWAAILGEEFGEACQAALHDQFGGSHAGTLREELVHVAAVAMQWIECIDRREGESLTEIDREPFRNPYEGIDFADAAKKAIERDERYRKQKEAQR